MPRNRSEARNELDRQASRSDKPTMPEPDKMRERPASLNNISKNEYS